jgi:hypothetical protein
MDKTNKKMLGITKKVETETQKILDTLEKLSDPLEKEAYIYRNTIKMRCGYTISQDITFLYNHLKSVSLERR